MANKTCTKESKIPKYYDQYCSFTLFAYGSSPPFRRTSLIYAEKFEFENPAIVEDKQCKQMEQFSVMANGSDYFLSLDDKSKQRYKIKINIIQDSGDISKFPPVQCSVLTHGVVVSANGRFFLTSIKIYL